MSTGETGGIGEIRTRLDQGIDELGEAYTPLEAGRANAAVILERTAQSEMALSGLISFFSSIADRMRDEVVAPYTTAATSYKKAAGLIVSSVQGADNEHAQNAGQGAKTISERTDQLLKATKNIGQSGHGSLAEILANLRKADDLIRQFSAEVGGAIDTAYDIQTTNHGQTMESAETYLEDLS